MRYAAYLLACIGILGAEKIVDACFIHSPLPVELIEDHITIKVKDRIAIKTYTCTFFNPNRQAVNGGTCYMEVEPGAQVDNMKLRIGDHEVQADILDVEKAKKVFQEIIAKGGSPALLEFYGKGLIRAQVPKIPPMGKVTAVLQYTTILKSENGLFQLRVLNTNPKAMMKPLKRVTVHATIESNQPIKAVYSPTHPIDVVREGENSVVVSFEQNNYLPKSQMAIYWHVADGDVGVSSMAYRDGADGTFMLMMAPTVDAAGTRVLPKDLVLCVDTSGSMMDDQRLGQVKKALNYIIGRLAPEDRFNVVSFSTEARPFAVGLVLATTENREKATKFVDDLSPRGATAIEEALERSLEMFDGQKRPRMLVFLTDGTPTIGETNPEKLLAKADRINKGKARIFAFGVGTNVNTKILDGLASNNGGTVDYILPKEDVTARVSNFYDRIASPVLSDIRIRFSDLDVRDVYPRRIPDLFKGQQIALFGRYSGNSDAPRTVVVTGTVQGKEVRHEYRLDFPDHAVSNDFLPRVWAGRKVAFLIEQVEKNGKNQEVIDEIVTLAKRYGIVTPYTSYLVAPDAPLSGPVASNLLRKRFASKGTAGGVGDSAVEESSDMATLGAGRSAYELDKAAEKKSRNAYRVMRTIGAKTFYFSKGVWQDAEYDKEKDKDIEKIKLASDAYMKLVKEIPGIVRFLALGKVIVSFEGTIYHITG